MFEVLIMSIGLVLIIEGGLYYFFASRIDDIIEVLKTINAKNIKKISLVLVFIGFCLIYFILRPYL